MSFIDKFPIISEAFSEVLQKQGPTKNYSNSFELSYYNENQHYFMIIEDILSRVMAHESVNGLDDKLMEIKTYDKIYSFISELDMAAFFLDNKFFIFFSSICIISLSLNC